MKRRIVLLLTILMTMSLIVFTYSSKDEVIVERDNQYTADTKIKNFDEFLKLESFIDEKGLSYSAYVIKDEQDMYNLSYMINTVKNPALGLNFKVDTTSKANFILGNFIPIGNHEQKNYFQGNFDGSGANFDLAIERNENHQALFGAVTNSTLKNLSVTGYVKGNVINSSVVSYSSNSRFENIYSMAHVTSNGDAAGISNYMFSSSLNNVYYGGNVKGESIIAGLTSLYNTNIDLITNSYSRATLLAKPTDSFYHSGIAHSNKPPKDNTVFYDSNVVENKNIEGLYNIKPYNSFGNNDDFDNSKLTTKQFEEEYIGQYLKGG